MTSVDDRYPIEAEIGRGAMGTVFRARHARLGHEVALKVLHPHLMGDPVMRARFEREAVILARLHHKNLVNVIDVGETPTSRFIVLDLVRGPTLAQIMKHALLSPARAVALTKQLLDGLAHAHDAGLVHRDLKPDNVIVERDEAGNEVPRIVDFGLAVLRDDTPRLTGENMILGTPAYIAPEQARGEDPDPRTDLFALGVIVYGMLAGKQPWDGTSMEIVLANMAHDPPRMTGVDPALEAFARKLMARRLEDRFASARDARHALEMIDRPLAKVLVRLRARKAAEPPAALPRPRRAWPLIFALAFLALMEVLR